MVRRSKAAWIPVFPLLGTAKVTEARLKRARKVLRIDLRIILCVCLS